MYDDKMKLTFKCLGPKSHISLMASCALEITLPHIDCNIRIVGK